MTVYIPGYIKRRMDIAEAWEVAQRWGGGPTRDMQTMAAHREVYPEALERDVQSYLLVAERVGAWG